MDTSKLNQESGEPKTMETLLGPEPDVSATSIALAKELGLSEEVIELLK